MSKNILELERKVSKGKRQRCPQCDELHTDMYTITDKRVDGSIFALMMCYGCLRSRFFFKKDYEKHRKEEIDGGKESEEDQEKA